jgi:hypothetical protein
MGGYRFFFRPITQFRIDTWFRSDQGHAVLSNQGFLEHHGKTGKGQKAQHIPYGRQNDAGVLGRVSADCDRRLKIQRGKKKRAFRINGMPFKNRKTKC